MEPIEKYRITVFTPAYNCMRTIKRLYDSLKAQTSKNFYWLVVNDGSRDSTDELMQGFIAENIIPTVYIKTENHGKYAAYNEGLKLAEGELFICVDSDDFMTDDAIEIIERVAANIIGVDDCCGFIAAKRFINNEDVVLFEKSDCMVSFDEICNRKKSLGEKCFVFKTEIAKNFTFPDISPEKFVPELYVYYKIGKQYKYYAVNDVLNICEYQEYGFSMNYVKLITGSPTGIAYMHALFVDNEDTLISRLSHGIRYNAFVMMSQNKKVRGICKRRTVVAATFIPGIIAMIRYKIMERRSNRK